MVQRLSEIPNTVSFDGLVTFASARELPETFTAKGTILTIGIPYYTTRRSVHVSLSCSCHPGHRSDEPSGLLLIARYTWPLLSSNMVLSRHEYTRALTKEISSKGRGRRRSAEGKRQDNGANDNGGDAGDFLAKGKGKGKGKGTEETPVPSTPIVGQSPTAELPNAQPPPPPAEPSLQLSPPPLSASAPPPVSSPSPPANAPTELPSSSPPAPTTTSVVISTSIAIDPSTSVQTSFVTITQSTVMRQETIITTETSSDRFVGWTNTSTSDVRIPLSTSSSTVLVITPSVAPLSPSGDPGYSKQRAPTDPVISPQARNLLIALGAAGQ
jgi:hypothetical protein